MLDRHLIAQTRPVARPENIVVWRDYRITVLEDRLFRLEQSASGRFRDEATQAVWFRDMPPQDFSVATEEAQLTVTTACCSLVLRPERKDCRIVINGKPQRIDNSTNLGGTYRTLDECNGGTFVCPPWRKGEVSHPVDLGNGVCARNGVAVYDDAASLTLGEDGEVKPERGDGTDEYIFAFGDDYRGAVRALYRITGSVPMIPRFALGNWWSRYYVYTDKEYLRLLNRFDEHQIPLTVATVDMDWHYSTQMEEDLHITEQGRNTPFYGGNDGWTGYSWNKRLFPDYKKFLREVKQKNLHVTLNLHPADGVRWWEDCYEDMARALGRDPATGEQIRFDIASADFINAYFSVIHKPYERDGVDFWWIDWQQGSKSGMDGLDPLWALNHYHTLDNAVGHGAPLIMSRYSGVGAHRYPLGFSGDTYITWDTLRYLPEFTLTAANVGYGWWSHDIGGHYHGAKDDELYLRHVQFGVFNPINRLHCCNAEVCTKEPWAYGNGAGEVAMQWLRLRHRLIPFLYTATYRAHAEGSSLVEPMYYEWKDKAAYNVPTQYLFGGKLIVAPIVAPAGRDGLAKRKVWLPEGEWIDIFTGAHYTAPKGGRTVTVRREYESIPVLVQAGGVLPLSLDEGNGVDNPRSLEVRVWQGTNGYTLYEDNRHLQQDGELRTHFATAYTEDGDACVQTLTVEPIGDNGVAPEDRVLRLRFCDVKDGSVRVWCDGQPTDARETVADEVTVTLPVATGHTYRIEVRYAKESEPAKLLSYARGVLVKARGRTLDKDDFWKTLRTVTTVDEYVSVIDATDKISAGVKACLKEIL